MSPNEVPEEGFLGKAATSLSFFVNGTRHDVSPVPTDHTLLEYLRQNGLTGTKEGCGEGGCGACTVLVSKWDNEKQQVLSQSVNACLAPLCSVEGCHVVTVEGIGNVTEGLHPVQERISKFHGSQCGYCTPGIVMSLYATLANNPQPSMEQIEESFDGNLCRCTGYRPILDAAKSFAVDRKGCSYGPESAEAKHGCGDSQSNISKTDRFVRPKGCSGCCRSCPAKDDCHGSAAGDAKEEAGTNGHTLGSSMDIEEIVVSCTGSKKLNGETLGPISASSFVPFPKELEHVQPKSFYILGSRVHWYRPTTLLELLELKSIYPKAKLVVGNTEIGIDTRFKNQYFPRLVCITDVAELKAISEISLANVTSAPGETSSGSSTPSQHESDADVGALQEGRVQNLAINGHAGVMVGGSVSLSSLSTFLSSVIEKHTKEGRPFMVRGYQALVHMLKWFASTQIRNVGSLAGNVATASPISDSIPVLLALDAKIVLAKLDTESQRVVQRKVSIKKFFKGYRTVDIQEGEVIKSIFIPYTNRFEFVFPFKQARRREDDISIVCSGMRVRLRPTQSGRTISAEQSEQNDGGWQVAECALAFGGMAPTAVTAKETEKLLQALHWEEGSLLSPKVLQALSEDLPLPDNVPGGMVEFRKTLCSSFLYRFYVATTLQLQEEISNLRKQDVLLPSAPTLAEEEQSAARSFLTDPFRPLSRGLQSYANNRAGLQKSRPQPHKPAIDVHKPSFKPLEDEEHASTTQKSARKAELEESTQAQNPIAPVGQPIRHKSGDVQVSGSAVYTDDVAAPPGTLHSALVLSTIPHGRILSFDTSAAEEQEKGDFVAFFSAKDVPGHNQLGVVRKDEECFMENEVTCVGQPVGIVVARTQQGARRASKLIQVRYENLPCITTIEEAIAAQSYHTSPHVIEQGDVDRVFSMREVEDLEIVEGEIKVGGQEHFYLETNATLVVPEERTGMTVISSTQNATETQMFVAEVLGWHSSQVVSKVKRMGGGFGGKESRPALISAAVAVAAYRLQRPVKITVDRDVDILLTGQRHPLLGRYRAAALRSTGRIVALDAKVFVNAGCTLDLSQAVLDRALFHLDGPYFIPHMRVHGWVCKTNLPSNTAFRGFGGPQGLLVTEAVVDDFARSLSIPARKIREASLYKDGDYTHFGQLIENCTLQRLWEGTMQNSDLERREKEIEEFNRKNKWKKRGMTCLATKFGINFTAKFMNQGGALVHVYRDGSVLVSHGGTEMGQGLHTKMIQIAARALEVPHSRVIISETSTDKVPNASPSAASLSTDLYGMAVLDACEQIKERLDKVRDELKRESREQKQEQNKEQGLSQERRDEQDGGAQSEEQEEEFTFEQVVIAAYFRRVNLSAQGFYVVPGSRCGYDWDQKPSSACVLSDGSLSTSLTPLPQATKAAGGRAQSSSSSLTSSSSSSFSLLSVPLDSSGRHPNAAFGHPFNYFTFGACSAEVELDVLTGDHRVVRADVFMDLGNSINPALDVGQIEGAFTQGLGLFTMEEMVRGDAEHPWVPPGALFTRGPGTYKIPAFDDVPRDLRVHLLHACPNPFAVHSSKAVGEPPLFLGAVAFLALKDAVAAARGDRRLGQDGHRDAQKGKQEGRQGGKDSDEAKDRRGETGKADGAEDGHEGEEVIQHVGPFTLHAPATAERLRMACADAFAQQFVRDKVGYQPKGSW